MPEPGVAFRRPSKGSGSLLLHLRDFRTGFCIQPFACLPAGTLRCAFICITLHTTWFIRSSGELHHSTRPRRYSSSNEVACTQHSSRSRRRDKRRFRARNVNHDEVGVCTEPHQDDTDLVLESAGYFWQCIFLAVVTSISKRQGALNYFTRRLPNFGTSKELQKRTSSALQGFPSLRRPLSHPSLDY